MIQNNDKNMRQMTLNPSSRQIFNLTAYYTSQRITQI